MGAAAASFAAESARVRVMPGCRVNGTSYATQSVEQFWLAEFDRQILAEEAQTGFPQSEWMTAGNRGSQDRPWWEANGPAMVRNFIDWYTSNPDVSVWVTPDGRPAIELGLTPKFGGVQVKMFIDLVLRVGSALVVVDLKSGARSPESLSQLGVYACGVELAYGIRPKYGSFFMLRGVGKDEEDKKFLLPPVELNGFEHSVEFYTRQFSMLDKAIASGVFVANVGDKCRRCGVQYACPAFNPGKAGQVDAVIGKDVNAWRTRTRA